MKPDEWERTDPESAAALRAYLQRCEVRLSTVHRVASALLSGAGLVVLFPALAKDSVARIIRALLEGHSDAPRRMILVSVSCAALLPVVALWQLLRDLVRFYFAGQHFDEAASREFYPRFALSGLRASPTDMSAETWAAIEVAHHDPNVRAFLLPENQSSRARVDDQILRYRLSYDTASGDTEEQRDEQRRLALLELAATGTRTLPQQAARLEQVLARHVLNIQILVLRYAKAVLAMLTTAIAAFAAGAVVDHDPTLGDGSLLLVASIIAIWAPAIIVAVTAPLDWIASYAKADNASDQALHADPQFSSFEDTTVRLAAVAWLSSTAAMIVHAVRTHANITQTGIVIGITLIAWALAFNRWDGRRGFVRLVSGPVAAR